MIIHINAGNCSLKTIKLSVIKLSLKLIWLTEVKNFWIKVSVLVFGAEISDQLCLLTVSLIFKVNANLIPPCWLAAKSSVSWRPDAVDFGNKRVSTVAGSGLYWKTNTGVYNVNTDFLNYTTSSACFWPLEEDVVILSQVSVSEVCFSVTTSSCSLELKTIKSILLKFPSDLIRIK